MTIAEISRAVDIPYPTATRFVQTLLEIGVLERSRTQKKYRPTALTKTLSCGYRASDRLVEVAHPYLMDLTKSTGWPAAIHTRVGASMVMLDSTHAATTLTFSEYYPGYSMPLTACAAGLAYLAFLDANTREDLLNQFSNNVLSNGEQFLAADSQRDFFDRIVESGFATYRNNPHSKDPGKSSSIGVPVKTGDTVVGAMTLVFFSSSMQIYQATEKYLDQILQAQDAINSILSTEEIYPTDADVNGKA